jgi:hypothetical protein
MSTPVSDLKMRLREFLSAPQASNEFRLWFLAQLRSVHKANDSELESLVHAVQRALSDAAQGACDTEELRDVLTFLVDEPMVEASGSAFVFVEANYFVGSYVTFQQSSFSASGSVVRQLDGGQPTSSWRSAADCPAA